MDDKLPVTLSPSHINNLTTACSMPLRRNTVIDKFSPSWLPVRSRWSSPLVCLLSHWALLPLLLLALFYLLDSRIPESVTAQPQHLFFTLLLMFPLYLTVALDAPMPSVPVRLCPWMPAYFYYTCMTPALEFLMGNSNACSKWNS